MASMWGDMVPQDLLVDMFGPFCVFQGVDTVAKDSERLAPESFHSEGGSVWLENEAED